MKLIHIGDLHIGRSIGDFDLIEDQEYILKQILGIAKQRKADAVLVAGDVYDRAVPGEAAVRLFDSFLNELAEEGLQAFIISGNHDSDERMNYGSALFKSSGIYIAARYEGELSHISVDDEYGRVNIYLMPFVKASQVKHFFKDEEIKNYDDAVRVVLKNANINPAERNVLVAHQFVTSQTDNPILSGSEGFAAQSVGLVEKISAESFSAFDYVALGHIHSAQQVGRSEVRYSGSPLKYSLSEAGHKKSVPIITLGEKGDVQVELVPLQPKRDLRHIRGRMEQLLAKENIISPNDFIYATLTDEDVINDAMGIFRQYYPNTIRIEYDNSHTRKLQEVEAPQSAQEKPFGELISEFYRQMYGCDISDEEMKLMREVAKEVGIDTGEDEI